MDDVEISLDNEPGELARMGEALGAAGVSVEGGGAWVVADRGVAHFLFEDGEAARQALEAIGMNVVAVKPVLLQKLRQDEPGQLGKICRAMAEAGVNIEVQYSDHDHQLVLVVDDPVKGAEVSRQWMERR
jgi:hypothetical protein